MSKTASQQCNTFTSIITFLSPLPLPPTSYRHHHHCHLSHNTFAIWLPWMTWLPLNQVQVYRVGLKRRKFFLGETGSTLDMADHNGSLCCFGCHLRNCERDCGWCGQSGIHINLCCHFWLHDLRRPPEDSGHQDRLSRVIVWGIIRIIWWGTQEIAQCSHCVSVGCIKSL